MTGRRKCTRPRRPVPHHARDDAVRHRRRAVDLVLPAHVRLHLEVDDRRGGSPAASRARVVPARRRIGRRLPACRHQVSLVRVFPEGLGATTCRAAAQYAARHAAVLGLCIGLGVAPGLLYAALPYPVAYVPYTASHVVSQLQLLLFSGLAFFLMLGWLKRTLTITLDTDWFWRRLGPAILARLDRGADDIWRWLTAGTLSAARLSAPACTIITALTASSAAPGRPEPWRFGQPSCSAPISSSPMSEGRSDEPRRQRRPVVGHSPREGCDTVATGHHGEFRSLTQAPQRAIRIPIELVYETRPCQRR